jgi:hypothetical protein
MFFDATPAPNGSRYQGSASQTVRITTTDSATYKLRARASGDGSASSVIGADDSAGQTKVVWKKISGFSPVTGQTTSYRSANIVDSIVSGTPRDLTTVSSTAGNMPFSNGVWTLTANTTYSFFATFTYDAGGTNQFTGDTNIIFCDAVSNVQLANSFGATSITPFFTGRGLSRNNTTAFTYTPTTNQTVKLRVTFANASGGITAQAVVEQIGTTSTSGFTGVMSNDWNINNAYASGTMVVKDQALYQANNTIPSGTAFTIGTTGATWRQIFIPTTSSITETTTITGSTSNPSKPLPALIRNDYITLNDDGSGWCTVLMDFTFDNPAFFLNSGSGIYLFTLPGGYQFNTTTHLLQNDTNTSISSSRDRATKSIGPYYNYDGAVYRSDNAQQRLLVFPHSATQFKLVAPDDAWKVINSSYYELGWSNSPGDWLSFKVQFRFKKA